MSRRVLAAALALAAGEAVGCGDDRASAPPPPPQEPALARVARTVAPCTLAAVPPRARVASRDPEGPWFYGQASFEYLRPAPRVDSRHVNHTDRGGSSSVGWRGEALTFELPPNTSLPPDSLLRHGPPPAIGYRASVAGRHRVSVVVCRTDREPPRVDLSIVRRAGGGDPIATTGELAPHPSDVVFWSVRLADARLAHDLEAELAVGDVVRLTASSGASAGGTLELAFDLAIAPPP